jgi:nicotinate-nucleotide--dimethylbenzimidazole phosphoribosyltransferase
VSEQLPGPADIGAPLPAGLGRLGPALRRLAAAQGAWPPHRPARAREAPYAAPDVVGGAAAVAAGREAADRLVDEGIDLVLVDPPARPGASTALAALLDLEPVTAVGTAGGAAWAAEVAAVRDGLPAVRALLGDPAGMLVAAGAPELAALAGLLGQCSVRRTPVLLAGTPSALAAAVVAERMQWGSAQWWLAGCSAPTPGGREALAELDLDPLLDLGLAVPGGAALALDVLCGGVDLVRG